MNIAQYLDSTYLKTPQQSGLSDQETLQKDKELEQLAMICSLFDNLNDDQKQRFLKFLCGRYYNFM